MATILHFADLHLDTDFRSVAAAARGPNSPRQSLRRCLQRIVDVALEQRVDALTIGGDLYEHDHRQPETWAFISEQLARLGETPVFIAPGNHDPCKPSSLYESGQLPGNARVFRSQSLEGIALAADVIIWGAGWLDYAWDGSPVDGGFHVPEDGRTHLLLLHGTLGERPPAPGERGYCPISEAAVRGAGFRAALLGHNHGARLPSDGSLCYYPGSTQALTFKETGGHYALLFDVSAAGRLTCERLTISDLPLLVVDVPVDDMDGEMVLRDRAAAGIAEGGLRRGMAKLRLIGTRRPGVVFDPEGLEAELSGDGLLVSVVDESACGYDFETLAQGPTTRACFVRKLLAERDTAAESEKPLYEDAIVLGLRAFGEVTLKPLRQPRAPEEDKER